MEVDRPDRKTRRFQGKSDPVDAEAAARAVLSGKASGIPKSADGPVEMVRVLRVARRSAVKNRTMAANQVAALVSTAPDELRDHLADLTTAELVAIAIKFRPGDTPDTVVRATKYALRELARRYRDLTEQIDRLDAQLDRLVEDTAPGLVARRGIATQTAAALLVTAGDNPDRLTNEACFAHLTGTAPLDASCGKQQRHRLNTGGDREASCALYRIVITRLSNDEDTKLHMKRRLAEGKTKKEVIRCSSATSPERSTRSSQTTPPSNPLDAHRSIPTVGRPRDGPRSVWSGCRAEPR